MVASIMLLAFAAIYLATMALGNHPKSEILVTFNAFVCVIVALNIENIIAISRMMPAPHFVAGFYFSYSNVTQYTISP